MNFTKTALLPFLRKEYYKGIPGITVDRVYGEVVKRLEEKNGK